MKTIVVIEDEQVIRENLADLLLENGYKVILCENGCIGATAAFENIPDLIICDVMMPDMDGFEVLQALRVNSNTASISFLFLTALNDTTSIRKGMNLGADDFLSKPYRIEDLLRAIEVRLIRKNESQNIKSANLIHNAINKIFLSSYAIGNIQNTAEREVALKVLRIVCNEEIELVNNFVDLSQAFAPEDIEIFEKLRDVLVNEA